MREVRREGKLRGKRGRGLACGKVLGKGERNGRVRLTSRGLRNGKGKLRVEKAGNVGRKRRTRRWKVERERLKDEGHE